jgi:hypothetical protein
VPNLKISEFLNDATAVAGGDKLPIADASALTINTYTTALEIGTHATTAPVFAAGTASANTWPKFTSGTLLTTAEDGAIERRDANFYGCTDAGNRGYIPVRHFIRCDTAKTLTSTASQQQLFDSPAGGTITLMRDRAYKFEGMLYITGLDAAAASNALIDIQGAGTMSVGQFLWHAIGIDGAPTTAASRTGSFAITKASVASIVTGVVDGNLAISFKGSFENNSANDTRTLIPSITLAVAAAGSVAIGSYFMIEAQGGLDPVTSVGQWT